MFPVEKKSIKQAFCIILKDEVFLNEPMAVSRCSLKIKLTKLIKVELYFQSPYIVLNYAFFILNFLMVDVHEQSVMSRFWHDGTQVIFLQVKWKEPFTGF